MTFKWRLIPYEMDIEEKFGPEWEQITSIPAEIRVTLYRLSALDSTGREIIRPPVYIDDGDRHILRRIVPLSPPSPRDNKFKGGHPR